MVVQWLKLVEGTVHCFFFPSWVKHPMEHLYEYTLKESVYTKEANEKTAEHMTAIFSQHKK